MTTKSSHPGMDSETRLANASQGAERAVQLSLPKLWAAFRHRRWLAMTVGVLLAGAGAALAWYFEKPKYTAVATVVIKSADPGLLAKLDPATEVRAEEFHKTQAFLVKSKQNLSTALKAEGVGGLTLVRAQDDPIHWLEKELQAGFIPGTDILRIGLTGSEPEELPAVVNAIMDSYIAELNKSEEERLVNNLKKIENIAIAKEEEVRKQRKMVQGIAEAFKTGDAQALTLRQKQMLEEASEMKREQSKLELEIRRLSALARAQRASLNAVEPGAFTALSSCPWPIPLYVPLGRTEEIPPAWLDIVFEKDPGIEAQRIEIARIEYRIEEHRKLFKAPAPGMAKLEEELKAANATLEKLKVSRKPEAEARVRFDLKAKRLGELAITEEKLYVAKSQLESVREDAARLTSEADKIGTRSDELEVRRNELEQTESVLKKLRAEKERLQIEVQSKNGRVERLHRAEAPRLNQASIAKSIATFSIIGLLLGVFGVSFLEARSHKVHRTGDIRHDLGLETLGELPLATRDTAGAYGKAGLFVEAVNSLCTTLLCDQRLGPNSVLMVASGNQREGKTFVSCHLAVGLARTGRRTLLIDGDLRKPDCHTVFEVSNSPGLSEVIRGETTLNEAVHTVKGSELQILTAGVQDQSVLKALSNASFKEILGRLRQEFDCIVIDSAPTMCVSDALLIGREADGVVQVVRPTVSDTPTVYSAYEKMVAMKIKFLGVVVNGITRKTPRNSYYASYPYTRK